MKKPSQREAEARKVYDQYWESYLHGDQVTFASTLDDAFEMIGTSESEICHNKAEGIAFFDAQMRETIGKVEMRNRVISTVPVNDMFLINEACDIYILTGDEWEFYSKIRISTFLRETAAGWKVVQQHGSLPDVRPQEGETVSFENLTKENLQLRDAVQRRTVELQHKNRELEIEAAMERVRAKALAMYKSADFLATALEIFQVLNDLGINPLRSGLSVMNEQSQEVEAWSVTRGEDNTEIPMHARFSADVHPVSAEIFGRWKMQDPHWKIELTGDALRSFVEGMPRDYVPMHESTGKLPSHIQHIVFHYFSFSKGVVFAGTDHHFDAEETGIMQKFTGVFAFAYTRFLDLQKAEAQAREAQIEASIEKVRSRTMAMQKSEELGDAAYVLFEQLNILGVTHERINIGIFNKEMQTIDFWVTEQGGQKLSTQFSGRISEPTTLAKAYQAWKSGAKSLVVDLSGEELSQWLKFMDEEIKIPFNKAFLHTRRVQTVGFFSKGALVVTSPEPLPDENLSLLEKFAGVFDLTYTRFSDLKQAEAQAREAQIELGLERVRARTMAMQKSEELKEVIQVVYEQFVHLNIHVEHAGFIMDYKAREDMHIWLADQHEVPFQVTIPYFDCAHWNSFIEAKEKGTDFFANLLGFEEKNKFYHDLFKLFPVPEETKEYYLNCPGLAISTVLLENVGLYIENFSGIPYTDEENNTLMRFGNVFQQTYTRFLDLKKVEEQARESRIELGLERVRARAMAMQHSDELSVLVDTLFQELTKLDFALTFCIINVINEADRSNTVWAASPETGKDPESYHMKFEDYKFHHEMWKAWKDRKTRWVYTLEGREKEIYDEYLYKETEFRRFPKKVQDTNRALKRYVAGFTFSNFGGLQTVSEEPISNTNLDILARFGKVFDLTYTRFNDLKQAEIQAREATKQASLDRVRGEIASMRSAADLEIITPLIWRELTTLGIPFIRCGVFIVHEEEEQVEVYLSKPDGTSLAVMHLPFDSSALATQTVDAWQQGSVFKQYWTQKDFLNWGRSMLEQGQIPDMETYQGAEEAPESLHLHFIPFKQGMLYVGSTALLSDEEIDLAASLAKAFSIAYARYEDFINLENAKAGIEEALAKLKATQSQLVQQEKLASLGQLTAGIAHEIKNPLNFVNNFSEVSIELVEELRDELKAYSNTLLHDGDVKDISDLLDDIKSNLVKIHEHGSRADGIVKSMLMHSKGGSGKMEPTDLNALVKEYVNLAYHGMRAGKEPINVEIDLQLDESIGEIPLVAEDFARVILNLCVNALDALRSLILSPSPSSLGREVPAGQRDGNYNPKLSVRTKSVNNRILIEVEDNGPGIPDDIKDKILQPFFTTKKGTEGTGLGLSITYDIVKAHGGEIHVKSHAGESSVFSITLPRKI